MAEESGQVGFGYKQHTAVDGNGLVLAAKTTPANRHDSQPFAKLVDKVRVKPGIRVHAGKAYCSKTHQEALKGRGMKNGIQGKAVKNKPFRPRQLPAIRRPAKSGL